MNKNRYVHVCVVGERAILIANIIMKREIIYYIDGEALLAACTIPCQPVDFTFHGVMMLLFAVCKR